MNPLAPDKVSFEVSKEDRKLIDKIMDRACAERDGGRPPMVPKRLRLAYEMSLAACAANGCPMDFQRLLDADDGNFGHDVHGINKYVSRDTGKLTNLFYPRYHKRS